MIALIKKCQSDQRDGRAVEGRAGLNCSALAAVCLLSASAAVYAADYPTRPVRIIVPFAAGGGTDLIARSIAKDLSEIWKQPVVIDNRGGGGGRIGAMAAVKASPDGYSMLFGSATVITVAPALHKNLSYDPMTDLSPIIEIASTPQVLSTHPSVPVKSVQELVRLAKAKPEQVLASNAGVGSAGHMAMALFESVSQTKFNKISYTGAGPALAALVGGHVHAIFNIVNTTLPQYKAGKLNALGISSLARLDLMPQVPTIAESGYPGFDTSVWYGLFVPANTPAGVVQQVHGDMMKILQTSKMRELLASTGFVVVGNTPEQFGTRLRAELDTWRRVIKENNIRAE